MSCFFIVIYNYNLNFKKKLFYLFFLIVAITTSTTLSNTKRFIEIDEKKFIIYKLRGYGSLDQLNSYSLSKCSQNRNINKIDAFLSGRVCGWEILIKNLNNKDLLFGKGFLADQILLRGVEKISSNSYLNILFNTGILSLIIIFLFITVILFKYFKPKNINNQNVYVSYSYYLVIFILCRSLLEDTIVFLNIDLMIIIISLLIIKNSDKKDHNPSQNR
jgi:hypothetical protein